MKKLYQIALTLLLLLSISISAMAQSDKDANLVQFSGVVLDGTGAELFPLPYVNVLVKEESRGTYTDFNGFFSIVVEKGTAIEFSAIGYKTVEYIVPDTLTDDRYSVVQLMTQDTINLPETVVFPWPSREHFRLEFLAMNVDDEMQNRARDNLTADVLERMREVTPHDGNESADFYLRQQSRNYYYTGQIPPMNIFNPMSWKQFFDSWERGDYKKKKKKK